MTVRFRCTHDDSFVGAVYYVYSTADGARQPDPLFGVAGALVACSGDRVAAPGSNGSGTSTLLDVLTGETEADAGTVRWAKGVRFVSYNRVYAELDLDDTVGHAVNAYSDSLAFTATKKDVNRFPSMLQFLGGRPAAEDRHPLRWPARPRRDRPACSRARR
ncbi:ATP-binding cassette domain-containing protein [Agromyces flavus]|uniref:ATP-binding cassette domain-containing protein n=1 Tax=Agromyces flavus TaxID=589382 RepID=UPI00360990EB